jgi:hypothetical protein
MTLVRFHPARSSSEDSISEASPREVFERRSSAVPSGAEGKQAGCKGWNLNSKHVSLCRREACPREVSIYTLVPQAK